MENGLGKRPTIQEQIVSGFAQLHLPAMKRAFEEQNCNLASFGTVPFNERLAALLTAEIEQRKNNSLAKRLTKAHLSNPMACPEMLEDIPGRDLNKEQILGLFTCDFIKQKRHVSIEGATGTGKTFLASAIVNAACRKGYKARYLRLGDLLNELHLARTQGNLLSVRNAYMSYDLLVLDEFLLVPVTVAYAFDLLDLVDVCSGKCSLILCTQYPHDEWYDRIDSDRPTGSDSTLAEAVLDRIIHHMETVLINSDVSMRKHFTATGVAVVTSGENGKDEK